MYRRDGDYCMSDFRSSGGPPKPHSLCLSIDLQSDVAQLTRGPSVGHSPRGQSGLRQWASL